MHALRISIFWKANGLPQTFNTSSPAATDDTGVIALRRSAFFPVRPVRVADSGAWFQQDKADDDLAPLSERGDAVEPIHWTRFDSHPRSPSLPTRR